MLTQVGGFMLHLCKRGSTWPAASLLVGSHRVLDAQRAVCQLDLPLRTCWLVVLQGKDLWSSGHFTTGVIGLVLLGLQGMLSAFFEVSL